MKSGYATNMKINKMKENAAPHGIIKTHGTEDGSFDYTKIDEFSTALVLNKIHMQLIWTWSSSLQLLNTHKQRRHKIIIVNIISMSLNYFRNVALNKYKHIQFHSSHERISQRAGTAELVYKIFQMQIIKISR